VGSMKKNNTTKIFAILFTITAILILFSSLGVSIYQHELVHVTIDNKVGITSHIEYYPLNGIPALATIRDTTQTRELTNLELAHSFNESIAYNLTPLLAGIMAILILGFILIANQLKQNI
jgi:hypothetical protein